MGFSTGLLRRQRRAQRLHRENGKMKKANDMENSHSVGYAASFRVFREFAVSSKAIIVFASSISPSETISSASSSEILTTWMISSSSRSCLLSERSVARYNHIFSSQKPGET